MEPEVSVVSAYTSAPQWTLSKAFFISVCDFEKITRVINPYPANVVYRVSF
jgi:hypothetical protein